MESKTVNIKNIIAKAKENDFDPETQVTEYPDPQQPKKTGKKSGGNASVQEAYSTPRKKPKKKTLNFEVPVPIANYWMGKIKGEGLTLKKIVADYLYRKYGLPEGYSKEDL